MNRYKHEEQRDIKAAILVKRRQKMICVHTCILTSQLILCVCGWGKARRETCLITSNA